MFGHTLHLVDIWRSQADFLAGKPALTRQDVVLQWNGPHPEPASRLVRVLDDYCRAAGRHRFQDALDAAIPWSDSPDPHGNLAHPSMAALMAYEI